MIVAPIARKSEREEVIVAASLVLPAALTLFGALVGGTFGFMVAAFAVGVGAAAGRLGFDSLLQRDGPDAVRGRSFARFETRFQLVWVIGGLLGVIPLAEKLGLFVLSLVLAARIGVVRRRAAGLAATGHAHEADARLGRSCDHARSRNHVRLRAA